MSTFHHQILRSTSFRRTALAATVRIALGAFALTGLVESAPASAQTQLGTITVTHPSGGGFWLGRWDTTTADWEWIFTDSSGGYGTYVGPPPASELCPALQAQWNSSNCPTQTAISYNGCGPEGILSWAVPDAPVPNASFHNACNKHDDCYTRLGTTQAECDAALGEGAAQACLDASGSFRSEGIDLGLSGARLSAYVNERIYSCKGFATIYLGAVMAGGAPHFRLAQTTAHCREMKELSNENGCGL